MALRLSLACPPYDRILPLVYKAVVAEGIELNYLPLEVEEIFWRQLRHAEFDISESSLSTYVMLRSRGDRRFIAIPVFTSRLFRNSYIFINTHKGIERPQDLKGRIVGLPEYQITAVVWLRGWLQDEFGVLPTDIHWRSGGQEAPGRKEKVALRLPPAIDLQPIPEDAWLSRMLDEGQLDALIAARIPSCFAAGSPNVARLFPEPRAIEEAYFRATGLFPIMHTVIMRREIYERDPWVALSLYKAFMRAKQMVMQSYGQTHALYATLPWLHDEVERTQSLLGKDWWPYGVAQNKHTLNTFLRYHYEQGLSDKQMTIEDLFASETLDEEFKI